MKNRASSHLLALLVLIGFETTGYYAVYRAGLIRGYQTSWVGGTRDLLLYVPILVLVVWLTRRMKFAGNWALYTIAILLFSIGLLMQYRLYSDPEYNSKNKAAEREKKAQVLRMRYIAEHYDADKKAMLGLPPTPAQPVSIDDEQATPARYTIANALTSGYTWIPVVSFLCFAVAFAFFSRDDFLLWLQRHSFVVVLLTLVPLSLAVVTSKAGKALGNMTPWEPSKIPFLLGFAGILTARYKDLARTYWGIPRARDLVPLIVMAIMPFIPFLALKDFGQTLLFVGVYATLYLVAVQRWPQILLFIGSVVLGVSVLVVGALPQDLQEKVPFLPTIARPVQESLNARIRQRFHLWLDGFDPPATDVSWWSKDFEDALDKNPKMKELAAESPAMQHSVNVDVWFDKYAYQPAQAIFGVVAGRTTGRGLGLGYAEVIPIADSDYIYAAIGEETGIVGGAIVTLALIMFVFAGVRTAIEARDMFTKLCSLGLTFFMGYQALINIGGTTRVGPMTGITLPFVSHGGFSLITSFTMLGMLMAFSHRNGRDARLAAGDRRPGAASTYRTTDEPPIPEAVQ